MTLTLTAPPTPAQTQAALASLPDGFAGLGETILAAHGLTADTLLIVADGLDAGARERRDLFPGGDAESAAMTRLATILRDAAPRYPHPPRLPPTPIGAEAAMRSALPGYRAPFGQRRRTWGAPTITEGGGEV